MEYLASYDRQLLETIIEKLEKIEKLLGTRDKPFLNMNETAKYIGITKNTLYRYTSKNIIPFYKLQGRRIYFSVVDLDGFVLDKRNKCSSSKEIEEKES